MRRSVASFLRLWLTDRRGDMVWSAVIMAFVLVPLASLTVDVPRYFILKARLQATADAAAQAAAPSSATQGGRCGALPGERRCRPPG